MSSEYSNYLASLNNNQHAFIQDHSDAIRAFEQLFANFTSIRDTVRTGRDKNNKTHISFLPFLTLMQRQAAITFDSLASYQSFTAWVNLRPCLEAALIIGKWVDDPNNAVIWQNRTANRIQYRSTYEGQNLRSRSLSGSDRIQTALKLTNDDFMHMNVNYYARHASRTPIVGGEWFEVQFFDSEIEHQAHIYAILHLLFVMQDALLSMFTSLFTSVSLKAVGLTEFETEFSGKVNGFLREHAEYRTVITERGLWNI